ncbi:MAG: chorismate-binding protein [Bacteroidota bacterium]
MGFQAGAYSVHHLFDVAFSMGWTLVGYRLPGSQNLRWSIPLDPRPVIWNKQTEPGFVLAPFSYPTAPAHWIARDVTFEGLHSLGDAWMHLPTPLRSALESIDCSIPPRSVLQSTDCSTPPRSALESTDCSIPPRSALQPNDAPWSPTDTPGISNDWPYPPWKGKDEAVLNEVERPEFELQIALALEEIEQGRIEKVVLARSEAHNWPSRLHPVDFVGRLCGDYPQAFVNLILHPEWGLWIGASPELLLEMEPAHDRDLASTEPDHWRRLRSMALAGTLPSHGQAEAWGDKEIREQQVVDDYIAQSWKNRVRNFRRSERNSIQAGPVQHLCTQLEGESNRPLEELVVQLHPTPAVGGWPKAEALQVISEIERGSRQLYGGFLGPIASPDEARLFVNLRTLQLRETQAHVHMGCGILGGSQPHLEWDETVHKSKTLLRHLLPQNPMDASAVD